MKVETWNIDRVVPYARNPRVNDEAVAGVAASIKEFGWQQPIVVDSEGVIVAGHTRFKAAQRLGLQEVPVVVASDLTATQIKAYRILDNKLSEKATWDNELLFGELTELDIEEFDMSEFDCEFDVGEIKPGEMPTLDDADEPAIRQITFSIPIEWMQTIHLALDKAKKSQRCELTEFNSNSVALVAICEAYVNVIS